MTAEEPHHVSVVVSGASGVIGRVLVRGLRGHRLRAIDRDDHDLGDPAEAVRAVAGVEQVVHLAWNTRTENFRSGAIDPANAAMTRNVLDAAGRHGVRRVVLASSIHADRYPAPPDGTVLHTAEMPCPTSLYGADKVFCEALGRVYAASGPEVVAVRFGGVNPADAPSPCDPVEHAAWLSHRDCSALVQAVLDAPYRPSTFTCVYAVSANDGGWHDLSNPFGWVPLDPVAATASRVDEARVRLP